MQINSSISFQGIKFSPKKLKYFLPEESVNNFSKKITEIAPDIDRLCKKDIDLHVIGNEVTGDFLFLLASPKKLIGGFKKGLKIASESDITIWREWTFPDILFNGIHTYFNDIPDKSNCIRININDSKEEIYKAATGTIEYLKNKIAK